MIRGNPKQKPKTLFEKLWENHVVYEREGEPTILYIDGHIMHEVTTPQAFSNLRLRGLTVRRPERCLATVDHNVSTIDQTNIKDKISRMQVETLQRNCAEFGVTLYNVDSPYQGIVHVIGPELGFVQPGMTVVCGDSHTSTNGALGALAWGIGTSEVEMVLATQCILQIKSKTMEIHIDGKLGKGVTAKDVILTIIRQIGVNGGTGHAIEYTGDTIRKMSMEERMTICNMSIEAGARMGMIAPDKTTFEYVRGRKFAPRGHAFHQTVDKWKELKTDKGAEYDKSVQIDAAKIEPLVTYGTNPSTGITMSESIPDPKNIPDPSKRADLKRALKYMDLKPGMRLEGFSIDEVFIGSCTNARLEDLRVAAAVAKGRKVKTGIKALIVPGSRQVKLAAEEEGLDEIFRAAGFEWRWSGCSACLAMNDDKVEPGHYCVSTSNRNYEGRQGSGARTFLASPIMAAAAAIEGKIVDVRDYL